MLMDYKFYRPLYITLHFNNYVKFDRGERVRIRVKNNHKHFCNNLHRLTYKKSKKQLTRYFVIERGYGDGLHSHLLIDTPEHLSKSQFKQNILNSWKRTKDGVSVFFEDAYNTQGLSGYNSKQQNSETTEILDAEVDVSNSRN